LSPVNVPPPSSGKERGEEPERSKRGDRDGAVVRALASHRCGPDSIPARCHIWVEFVVGSRPAPRDFLRVLGLIFLPLQKPTSPNSNSTRIENPRENQLRLMWLPL